MNHPSTIRPPHRAFHRAYLTSLAFALLSVLTPSWANAQTSDVTVSAAFDRSTVYLGDTALYEIVIQGTAQPGDPPSAPLLDGAKIAYSGNSSEIYRAVGYNVRRTSYRYTVTPNRSGEIQVPPLTVQVGGQNYSTNPATLRVLPPTDAEDTELVFSIAKQTVYAGQPVDFGLAWYIDRNVQIGRYDFTSAELPDGIEAELPPSQRSRGSQNSLDIQVFDGLTTFRLQQLDRNGAPSMGVILQGAKLIADQPGTYTFDNVHVTYEVNRRERKIARARPVTLEVLPLPPGAPTGFDGLIGTYEVSADASPLDVNVGDPIQLRVAIKGREPMKGVLSGPDLSVAPGFLPDFKLATDGWSYDARSSRVGVRAFTTTIRAATDGVTEIPPIPVSFFDPDSGTYRTAQSDPIPLSVRAVRQVTAADATVRSPTATTSPRGVAREGLTNSAPGLWAVETGPSVLATEAFEPSGMIREPLWIVVFGAPPLLFVASGIGIAARKRHDPVRSRQNRALSHAHRVLSRDGSVPAVRAYLADMFSRPATSLTVADCEELLGGHVDDRRGLAELLAKGESDRFGGVSERPDTRDERARTRQLLDRVDRDLRRARR